MTLPKVRLTISPAEYAIVKPGLTLLVGGMATCAQGVFPHRHPWDRIDPQRANVYSNRVFDNDMVAKIFSVHEKLLNLITSRKIWLDTFELAAAAFALRVVKHSLQGQSDVYARSSLARKLEIYRKRAKCAATYKLGMTEYRQSATRWRQFLNWCRYNLLYFHVPHTSHFPRRRLWSEQRSALSVRIRQTLEQHCFAPLSDTQMTRVVRLLKEEFRRGRHPMR